MSATLRHLTTTVTLPGPQLGDAVIRPNAVRLHLSMAGSIRTSVRKPREASKLLLVFEALCLDDYNALVALIEAANGDPIRYTGPQGIWLCRVMNNPIERTARTRTRYTVTLELVGRERRGFLLLQTGGYLLLQTGCYLELNN